MKKLLIILSLIIIIPVVGLIAAVYFVDINNYKPQIEKLIAKYAKVDTKINGDMKIGLSLKPSIEISDVSVSNQESKDLIANIGAALVQFSIKPLFAKEFVVDNVQTDNTKIYYSKTDYVQINNLDVSMESYDSPIVLDIDTDVSGTNIRAKGTISSFKYLNENKFDKLEADLKIQALGYTVDYKGNITDLQSALKATGKYTATYKSNQISGDIYVSLANKLPYIKLSADSQKINISDFSNTKSASAAGMLISGANASTLVKNTAIPYDYLKMADVDATLKIKQLILNNDISLTDFNPQISLKNGVLKINLNNTGAGDGKISATLDANANNQNASLNLKGTDVILQKFYKPFAVANGSQIYIKNGGKSNFLANIKTMGKDTNSYIANANGQVIFLADSSVLRVAGLDKLRGNIIVQILEQLKIKISGDDLNLKCAVVRGDIANGKATYPKGIVFDAKDFYLVADGTTNFNNDKINLTLQPFSGKITDANISSILGSLLKIKGTFSNPQVGVNTEQTAGAVVGAIATGGIYNVSDMMLSADASPCFTALQGTQYASYFPQEKGIKTSVSNQYNNTKDAVKNVGKNIKNLGTETKNQLGGMLKGFIGKND